MRHLAVVVLSCVLSCAAFAAPVTFEGTVGGFFNSGATSLRALQFTPAGSFLGVADQGPAFDEMSLLLGTFTVTRPGLLRPVIYATDRFTVDITFAQPLGIVEDDSVRFVANLIGGYTFALGGVAGFIIPDQDLAFTFHNSSGSGSFILTVNNLAVTLGVMGTGPTNTAQLTGSIHDVVYEAPEPATFLLLGTALLGLPLILRRRLRG